MPERNGEEPQNLPKRQEPQVSDGDSVASAPLQDLPIEYDPGFYIDGPPDKLPVKLDDLPIEYDPGFEIGELPPLDPNMPPSPFELGLRWGTEEWKEAEDRLSAYFDEKRRNNPPADTPDTSDNAD